MANKDLEKLVKERKQDATDKRIFWKATDIITNAFGESDGLFFQESMGHGSCYVGWESVSYYFNSAETVAPEKSFLDKIKEFFNSSESYKHLPISKITIEETKEFKTSPWTDLTSDNIFIQHCGKPVFEATWNVAGKEMATNLYIPGDWIETLNSIYMDSRSWPERIAEQRRRHKELHTESYEDLVKRRRGLDKSLKERFGL